MSNRVRWLLFSWLNWEIWPRHMSKAFMSRLLSKSFEYWKIILPFTIVTFSFFIPNCTDCKVVGHQQYLNIVCNILIFEFKETIFNLTWNFCSRSLKRILRNYICIDPGTSNVKSQLRKSWRGVFFSLATWRRWPPWWWGPRSPGSSPTLRAPSPRYPASSPTQRSPTPHSRWGH